MAIMKEQITYDIFDKVDIRVGTVVSVKKNEKARKPSLVVEVDFGEEIGLKKTSAQITNYDLNSLTDKKCIAVINLGEKQIGPIMSQCLVLGSISSNGDVLLLSPEEDSELGDRVS